MAVESMFRQDWNKMLAEGLKPTVDDAIHLNALAVRAKHAGRPFSHAHLRRTVYLTRGIELREPTIAHEIWIEKVARYIDINDNLNFHLLHAYALSREARRLPNPDAATRVAFLVFHFARKIEREVTRETLADAVDFVLFGSSWTVGELPPPRRSAADAEVEDYSPTVGIVLHAISRGISITLDDAMRMTASELLEAASGAASAAGSDDPDRERNDALGDYFAARTEILERLREEKRDDGE